MQFFPNAKGANGINNQRYMHTFIESGEWQYDHFNRMRFWILMPPEIDKAPAGRLNLHFGTCTRKTTASSRSAESNNGHFYHHYNVPNTGVWHQVIVD